MFPRSAKYGDIKRKKAKFSEGHYLQKIFGKTIKCEKFKEQRPSLPVNSLFRNNLSNIHDNSVHFYTNTLNSDFFEGCGSFFRLFLTLFLLYRSKTIQKTCWPRLAYHGLKLSFWFLLSDDYRYFVLVLLLLLQRVPLLSKNTFPRVKYINAT